jgi:hypothetical protein
MDESGPGAPGGHGPGDAEAFGWFYRRREPRLPGRAIAPPLAGWRAGSRSARQIDRERAHSYQTVLFAPEREQHGSDPVAAR